MGAVSFSELAANGGSSRIPQQGSKLRPIQSHLRLKYLEKLQICDLLPPSLFRNKRVSSSHFAAKFAKINK